ncbi:DsbA family oxidoreductase, partial [Nitriliruptoria bacterium AS10]|nr:DsbA family oxidoreductase [Salsipaludibacter albus]
LAHVPFADEVDVRWRSFELDPDRGDLPDDVDYVGMLAAKYATTPARAQQMVDQMTATGAAEGIAFRFDLAR